MKNTTTKNTVTLTDKIEVQFPVIQKGSKGTAVSMLQAMLGVKVDGDFGNDTDTSAESISEKRKAHSRRDLWKRYLDKGD